MQMSDDRLDYMASIEQLPLAYFDALLPTQTYALFAA